MARRRAKVEVEVVNAIVLVGFVLLDVIISSYKSQGSMRCLAWLYSSWYCADPGLSCSEYPPGPMR